MKIRHKITGSLYGPGWITGKAIFLLFCTSLILPLNSSAQGVLEEIVVTAQKREQNLQEVPIAITALDETAIEHRGLNAIEDLVTQVPTLQFSAFGSLAAVSLRGVSYENTTPGGDPGVAMHTDGVYLGRPIATVFDVWDMERMEVLRGPQGTLYGRNTTGGSINFISKRPTDEMEGQLDFTYGNYERVRARGMLNMPVNESLKTRFSVAWEDRDGYQKNLFEGGNEAGDKDSVAVRGSVLAHINEDADLLIIGNYIDTGGVGRASESSVPYPTCAPPRPCAVLPGGVELGGFSSTPTQLVNDLTPNVVAKDTPETSDQEFKSIAGIITWDLGAMAFKSITAYAEMSYLFVADTDNSERPILDLAASENQDQFSQELQLASTGSGPLQWLVGAFFFTEDADRRSTICNDNFQSFTFSPFATGYSGDCPGFGITSPTGEQGFSVGGDIESTSYAVFAQIDYDVTSQISVTAGARFSWDEKDATLNQYSPFFPVGNFIPANPPLVLVPGVGPVPFAGPATPIITGNFINSRKQSWSEPTWKFNINWAPVDDINLYALYSRGYKSGGANLNGATIEESFYDPEFIDSYEVGAKMRFMDKLQLNISAYYNEIDELQLQVFGNGGAVIDNAASATVEGIEIESVFVVTDGFEINGSIGVMDAEYDEFLQAVGPGVFIDRSGNDLNRAPKTTVNVGGTYNWHMSDIGSFVVRVDYHWQDKQWFQPENAEPINADSYDNLNIRGFWYSNNKTWTVEAYATNLTDETQVGDVIRAVPFLYGGTDLTSYKAPRMYGVRIGYKFF